MSVRRLAEDTIQPEAFSFNRTNRPLVKTWISKYPKGREASAVIPLLMIAQEQEGWVTKAAIEHVAETLQMPFIRVLEVATFYTQFMLAPVGTKAHVQVCGTTPCMLRGSEELKEVCRKKIHPEQFHTNEDGTLSWEEVECQGACVNAPMVMIWRDTYEDLTPERLSEIIDAFESGNGAEVKTGPQIDRIFAAPEGGLTTLATEIKPEGTTSRRTAKSDGKKSRAKTPPANAARPDTETLETASSLAKPSKARGPGKGAAPEDAGPTLKLAATARSVKGGKKKEAAKVTEGNSTMKLAATAKNRAAPKSAPKEKAVRLDDKDRPESIKKPAKPDDLKMISGVGPKIEKILNDLGIYKFEQIAKWKKAEREWVDGYLRFKGRIDRDDWVKQAKALAKGGRDEYVRVFGKEPR